MRRGLATLRRTVRHAVQLLVAAGLVGCGGGSGASATAPGNGSGTPGGSQPGGAVPTLRLLWIGNSYTYVNDLPALLTALSTTAGRTPLPVVTTVLDGGQTLKGAATRADIGGIIGRGWDVVVLQEQSSIPITAPDTMLRYGTQLGELAKRAGAKVLLFQTWPTIDATPSAPAIRTAYANLARALDATVVPVGDAWVQLLTDRPDLPLYLEDGTHPTPLGSYLAACLFHNVLFQRSAVGLAAESYSVRTNRYVAGVPEPIVKVPLSATMALTVQQAADRATGR